jgi:hypothetical protein
MVMAIQAWQKKLDRQAARLLAQREEVRRRVIERTAA